MPISQNVDSRQVYTKPSSIRSHDFLEVDQGISSPIENRYKNNGNAVNMVSNPSKTGRTLGVSKQQSKSLRP